MQKYIPSTNIYWNSLRSRRLVIVCARKNGRARRRHARGEGALSPLACLPRTRPFSLSPTTSQPRPQKTLGTRLTTSKRLLRRLILKKLWDWKDVYSENKKTNCMWQHFLLCTPVTRLSLASQAHCLFALFQLLLFLLGCFNLHNTLSAVKNDTIFLAIVF